MELCASLHYEERMYLAALHWVCISTVKLEKFLAPFDSICQAWKASGLEPGKFRSVNNMKAEEIEIFAKRRQALEPESYVERMAELGVRMVLREDPDYPENLRNICQPPGILYVRGNLAKLNSVAVALVGTRKASQYGKACAEFLAEELARAGVAVVSGLARGIDSAAHRGALAAVRGDNLPGKTGLGVTAAVLGCGADVVYPRENAQLIAEIAENGIILTEYPLGTAPSPWNFPFRNRIISGLAQAVVVVEAEEKSGSLITADFALEQGREVLAVPGSIFNKTSLGPHKLIRQGARIVGSAGDILEELGLGTLFPKQLRPSEQPKPELNGEEAQVIASLNYDPVSVDFLAGATGLQPPKLLAVLTYLELKGLIKQVPGQKFLLDISHRNK